MQRKTSKPNLKEKESSTKHEKLQTHLSKSRSLLRIPSDSSIDSRLRFSERTLCLHTAEASGSSIESNDAEGSEHDPELIDPS